jgi:hypothetical protein
VCKLHPRTSDAEKDLMIGLATWLDDDTIEVRLSNRVLADASSLHPDTVKGTKPRLRKKGWLDYEPARRPGELTLYRVLILEGGVSRTPPSKGGTGETPPSPAKGGSGSQKRGGREAPKGGVGKSADQPERDHKLNPLATTQAQDVSRDVRKVIRAAVADATDDETDTYARQIQDERHPDNLARYLGGFPAAKIVEGIMSIRRSKGGGAGSFGDAPADSRPSSVPYKLLCARCSRPGHDAANCPDRPVLTARPAVTAGEMHETPCAAGEKCRQTHTSVPDDHEYHDACQTLGGLRAPRDQAKRADHDEVGRRIAAEQLAEMRAAGPARDGGHAA